ncbi:MAG TPA: hypothetical protein VGB95_02475 [Chitinophagales bacterium]
MPQTSILYIGTHREIAETVVRLLNAHEDWFGVSACDADEAKAACTKHLFDVVLLGNGLSSEAETSLKNYVETTYPNTKVIRHYGGGSGLLYNEILAGIVN